jgi:hypothetical protein
MTIEPPEAKKIPSPRTFHGDTVVRRVRLARRQDDPDTIGYLRAENAYTDAAHRPPGPLRDQIFEEIKRAPRRATCPSRCARAAGGTTPGRSRGKQYAVFCRRAVRPGEVIPPMAEDGKPLDGEEELLDGNELAVGHEFFSLGAFRTSPDQRWLAYSTDFSGNERFTLRDQGPGHRGHAAGRDTGHLRRLRVVPGRLRRVLHDRGRGLAAVPGLAAPARHRRRRGHHGLRGAGRAFHVCVGLSRSESYVMIRCVERADQRGLAARRGRSVG